MTKTLKLEVSVDNIGENGAIASTFATTEFVQTELNKKVNLTPEGKVDHTQLPDYTYISGLPEALEDERILREEAEATTLSQAKTYSDQKLSETAAKKADLIEGKVPFTQLPYNLNLEQNIANEFIAVRDEIKQTSDGLVSQIATLDTDLTEYVDSKDSERKDYIDRALFTFLEDLDLRYNEASTRLQGEVDAVVAASQTKVDAEVLKLKKGETVKFDQAISDAIGGYPLHARIGLENGDIVKSTVANNTVNPNTDMTGWVKINAASQIFDESGKTQQEVNDVQAKTNKRILTPMEFGALGDGSGAKLSSKYATLAAAQVDFPSATSLDSTIDTAAIQEWLLDSNGIHLLGDDSKTFVVAPLVSGGVIFPMTIGKKIFGNGATIKIADNSPMFYAIFGDKTGTVDLSETEINGLIIDHNKSNRIYTITNSILDHPNCDFSCLSGKNIKIVGNTIKNPVNTNSIFINGASLVENITIENNIFLSVGGISQYYDHSTIYTNGINFSIANNMAVGASLGANGTACFIETHSTKTRIYRNFCLNFNGFCNFTGIYRGGDVELSVISDNIAEVVQFGIRLFSTVSGTHTTGYGINGLDVLDNRFRIHQHSLLAGTFRSYLGVAFQSGSSLPSANVRIIGNSIEYDFDIVGNTYAYDAITHSIGVNESTGSILFENIEITNNTVINSPITAIGLGFGGGNFKNCKIGKNTIINAAQGLNTNFASYKNAISILPNLIVGMLNIDEQTVIDNIDVTRLVNAIVFIPKVDSTSAQVTAKVSVELQGDKVSFIRAMANNGNLSLPLIDVRVNKTPSFLTHSYKKGSQLIDTTSETKYSLLKNGSVWKVSEAERTYDPPSIAAGATVTATVGCYGFEIGDVVSASFSQYNVDIEISAAVSASGVVTVKFKNIGVSAVDLASGTLTVKLI